MDSVTKAKEWIKVNAPMLAVLYENKYVGMVYDRFASLPPNDQKKVLGGVVGGFAFLIFLIVFTLYMSVWGSIAEADRAQTMMDMLLRFQKTRRTQETDLQALEQNRRLGGQDGLKKYLIDQARAANISPRMVKAEERPDAGPDATKGPSDIAIKQATIRLEKINLMQLKDFLKNVEFGPFSVIVSSVQISNDDKIRGYMNVELGAVAYLFKGEDDGNI